MIAVIPADCFNRPLVKRFKQRVEILIIKIGRNRLIHKFIAKYYGLFGIMGGYSCPDVNKEFLGLFAFEKPGISVAVVNVVSGLSSRTIVHIENKVESGIPAPLHERIYPFKSVLGRHQTHIILVGE